MIYISAGHHDKDPGAIGNGYKESELNIELRDLIIKELDKMGVKYIKDKDWETNTQYQGRIKPGNGSVLLDIHFNSSSNSSATGVETIVKEGANIDSKNFAKDILNDVVTETKLKSRGVKSEKESHRGKLGILHTKAGISCLLEVGFISNINDIRTYKDSLKTLPKKIATTLKKYEDLIE